MDPTIHQACDSSHTTREVEWNRADGSVFADILAIFVANCGEVSNLGVEGFVTNQELILSEPATVQNYEDN